MKNLTVIIFIHSVFVNKLQIVIINNHIYVEMHHYIFIITLFIKFDAHYFEYG